MTPRGCIMKVESTGFAKGLHMGVRKDGKRGKTLRFRFLGEFG